MKPKEKVFEGLAISSGISIGIVHFCKKEKPSIKPSYLLSEQQIDGEVSRFKAALAQSKQEIEKLKTLYGPNTQEEEGVLTSHLMMLEDPMIVDKVETAIRTQKKGSAVAFEQVVLHYKKRLAESNDDYFRQRVDDIVDISTRIIHHLCSSGQKVIANAPKGSVIVSESLLPSEVIEADVEKILGFVTKSGGKNSHTAIIAKAKGIPYVSGIDPMAFYLEKATFVIVDGVKGKVIANPTEETIRKYEKIKANYDRAYQKIEKQRFQLPETIDGYQVFLMGSLDTLDEVDILSCSSVKGIGLYRSEHLYYKFQQIPSEKIQYDVYLSLSQKMEKKTVIIRAFDLEITQLSTFSNKEFPPMSCRAIRALLKNEMAFRIQVRALLKANTEGNIKLLLPMVVDVSEVLQARKIVEEEQDKLKQSMGFLIPLEIGAMLEVPASMIMCESIAREVDFFSIGSNDLMQYTLAADRNSANLVDFYSSIHPSVLRLLRFVMASANRYKKKVYFCGELASDTRLLPLFLGLGIQHFTVSTRKLPFVIQTIRNTDIVKAYEKAEKAVHFTNAEELLHFLKLD